MTALITFQKPIPILAGQSGGLLPRRKDFVLSKKEIGDRIKTLRQARNVTQVELARMIGAQQTNLSQIERGVRGVGVGQILKLSQALRVTPDKLIGSQKSAAPPRPQNERLLKRVRHIEKLPAEHQDAVVRMLDAFLGTQPRQAAHA
jgi:transcriptional regulator with XRE-family HTH domain